MKLRYGGKDLKRKEGKKEDIEGDVIERTKKENKRNTLGAVARTVGAVALGASIVVGGVVGCEKDNGNGNGDGVSDVDTEGDMTGDSDELDGVEGDVPEEDGTVIPGTCEYTDKPAADLQVSAAWGYDNEEDGTCRTEWGEGGCLMGAVEGDVVKLRAGESEETWTVTGVELDEDENEVLVLENASGNKIKIDAEKSIYWEGDYSGWPTEVEGLGNLRLAAVCTNGICSNGVSADVDGMTGKALVEVHLGETVERVLLSEEETATVKIGEIEVEVSVGKITESQAYINYSIKQGVVQSEGDMKVALSEKSEEAVVDDVFGVLLKNDVSADSNNAACYDTVAVLTLTDDSGITWDVEVPEGETIELPGGVEFVVNKVLVDSGRGEYGELEPSASGAVKLVQVDGSGEWSDSEGGVLVLKNGESQSNILGTTITVKEVRKISLVEETSDEDVDY